MSLQRYGFLAALLICGAAYFLNAWLGQMPVVKPATVSEAEFSAERAKVILEDFLEDGVPHPVGSDANIRVKQKILDWLENEEIQVEVQKQWGCSSRRNNCAWVENIIAEIPGQSASTYLVLMAHYDSVPDAPGAGDDGAGVAAVLEIGRMLKREGPLKNPVLLLITDAEEVGLLGAEAFFAHHPKKDSVGAIINVEGSGSSGPSRLLRTAMNNKSLIDAYGAEAQFPQGVSLTSEIFKRMPNDTDFSVSARANVPGIDFAFAGERNHYHTPNDTVENLDLRTLQHHGENVLPLARQLASIDLDNLEIDSTVFSSQFGRWVAWSNSLSLYLLILAGTLLAFVSYKLNTDPRKLLLSIVSPLVIIVGVSLVLLANFKLIEWINGTVVSWPAHDLPFRLVLFGTAAFTGFLLAAFFNRILDQEEGLAGLWWFWWLLALPCVFLLPDAANLFILPLIFASLLMAVSVWFPVVTRKLIQLATLVMVVPASLSVVLDLEITQGYRLIITTFFFLGIFLASIAPFVRGAFVRTSIVTGVLLGIVGTLGATTIPLYSAFRPQHINFQFIQNVDEQTAYWRAQTGEAVPPRLMALKNFSEEAIIFPWLETTSDNLAVAEPVNVTALDVEVVALRDAGQGREVDLRIKSNREAESLMLLTPGTKSVAGYVLDGNYMASKVPTRGMVSGHQTIMFSGVQHKTIELTIRFVGKSEETVYLVEGGSQLPDSSRTLEATRHPLGAPVHRGDHFMVIRKIEI